MKADAIGMTGQYFSASEPISCLASHQNSNVVAMAATGRQRWISAGPGGLDQEKGSADTASQKGMPPIAMANQVATVWMAFSRTDSGRREKSHNQKGYYISGMRARTLP